MNIYKNDEARQNVLEGAEVLYDAVRTTLGPKGRNVLIRDKFGGFTITHDGVTVAKAVQLKDDPKSVGVEIIKEASKKMDTIGDGTTTVTVLAYHLMKQADKLIKDGLNPMLVKRELEGTIPYLLEQVESQSKKIEKNFDAVADVATVSVGDVKLGGQIAALMDEVGFDGAISVSTTRSPESEFKVVEGFSFDRGYMSPYFITDQSSREAVLRNPAFILINGPIIDLEEFKNIFDVLFTENIKSVVVVAENVEAEPLGTLILNKVKNVLNVVAVKTPGHGADKLENLRDIAAITGATVIDPSIAGWEQNLGVNTLGAAEKAVVSFDETIILGGQGGKDVEARIEKLKKRFKKIKEDEKPALEQRIANLKGSVGIIRVGGQTDTEAEEKKYRIDDAVAAVKAAMKGGIVPGGGVALRDIAYRLDGKTLNLGDVVVDALRQALLAPQLILLENSGYERTLSQFKEGEGLNVLDGSTIEMIQAGIVDPTEVTKEVVKNAITTACLAITVGGSIVEEQLTTDQMTALMSNVQ